MKILYGAGLFLAFVAMINSIAPSAPPKPHVTGTIAVVQDVSASTNSGGHIAIPTVTPSPVEASNIVRTPTAQATPASDTYQVIKVVDGDTLVINKNGSSETVRLIGIDTPETVDPRKTVQCFGKEASDMTKSLLVGRQVRIETDPTQGERDKYDRLLAYVYRDDGLFINKYLIENGYAHEYTYRLPYRYQADFKAAQKIAQTEHRGLWAPDVCDAPPLITATPSSTPTPQPTTSITSHPSSYSCSTNTYNCTDFATHAEAQAMYEMCGGTSNDVHKLDSDKDGVVCESLL